MPFPQCIEAAKRFFVEVLGMQVERVHPTFVQFKDDSGRNFAIASDTSMTGSREREVYWLVGNAEAAYQECSANGEVSMPLKQLPFGKVSGITDPAGQPHYVIELAKHRPSKQVSRDGCAPVSTPAQTSATSSTEIWLGFEQRQRRQLSDIESLSQRTLELIRQFCEKRAMNLGVLTPSYFLVKK